MKKSVVFEEETGMQGETVRFVIRPPLSNARFLNDMR